MNNLLKQKLFEIFNTDVPVYHSGIIVSNFFPFFVDEQFLLDL